MKHSLKTTFLALGAFVGALFFAPRAVSQIPVALAPVARQQFLSPTGVPLANGCIFTYAAGTSTPQATYSEPSGTFPNTNPIILDAGGFASIWLPNQSFRIVIFSNGGLNCATGSQQYAVDNVSAYQIVNLFTNTVFFGVTSFPPGTPGELIYRSDLGRFCFFYSIWDCIPGLATTDTFTNKTFSGGTITGTTINNPTINNNSNTGNVANKYATASAYRYVDGAGNDSNDGLSPGTAYATPQKCLADITALGGGTCDARTLYTYTYGDVQGQINVGQNSPAVIDTLLVPPYGTWTCNLSSGSCLEVFNFGSVIGTGSGSGIQFQIIASATSSVADVCGTDAAPVGGGAFDTIRGLKCIALSGATVSVAVIELQKLFDINSISDISAVAQNTNTKALYAHGLCCSTGLARVAGFGNNATGNVPCTFGSATDAMNGAVIDNISCTHAGSTKNQIVIFQSMTGNTGAHYSDIYTEADVALDTNTPIMAIANASSLSDVIDNVHVGTDAAGGASTRCIVDVASGSSVTLRNIQQINATCAINDHNPGRGIVTLGAFGIITDYSTNNGACCTIGAFSNGSRVPVTIAFGTAPMTTVNIPTGNCGTTVTVSAPGVLTTDTIDFAFNSAIAPSNPAVFLNVVRWPTAGNVNFAYCNPDSASQTPSAATINWSVRRP